jgi:hypothetical protein
MGIILRRAARRRAVPPFPTCKVERIRVERGRPAGPEHALKAFRVDY